MSASRPPAAAPAHAHDHGGKPKEFIPLGVAVLAVSDTRTPAEDDSGDLIRDRLEQAGHRCVERTLIRDEVETIREQVRAWCGRDDLSVVVISGGTGVTTRDVTPEALEPLFDKPVPGFGEVFRWLSYREIGSSTIQSRATAGVVGGKLVFALPGSPNACRLAMDEIILPQLDNRTRPCSFVSLLQRV